MPEKAMATHSSTLAWEIPWMEEPGRLQSIGLQSLTRLSDFTFTFHFHALEKAMATHSSVLAWRIPEMVEPGGLPSLGSHRVGHNWSDLAAAAAVLHAIDVNVCLNIHPLKDIQVVFNFHVQFSSVTHSCLTLCDPMDCSTSGLPIHHQLLEFTQTQVHWIGDAIQPSHPLLSPSLPAFNLSQRQSLFKWVSSSCQVTKVLELQLHHQSLQWIFRTDFL